MSEFIKNFFFECVEIMHYLAWLTFSTYKEINTLIFLVIQPSLIIFFFILWRKEKRKSKNLPDQNKLTQN
jgi:hypothetical protein